MSLNLTKTVLEFLQAHQEEKFTAREIADWILKTYPAECREKQARSKATVIPLDSEAALVQQIVAEISAQRPQMEKKSPQLKTTDGRPRKYYYSARTDEAELTAVESPGKLATSPTTDYSEHHLYPMLSEYLWREFNIYSKKSMKSAPRIHTVPEAIAGFSRSRGPRRPQPRVATRNQRLR